MEDFRYKNNNIEFGLTPQLPYSVQEAVNRLRINISFLGSDVRRIMVISSEPNEGKSFLAMHLWNQMAEAGEKTILVDADMRNSNIVTKYDIKRTDGMEMKGTTHYLAGNAQINEVLVHTRYGYAPTWRMSSTHPCFWRRASLRFCSRRWRNGTATSS